ncbi:MAG: amidase [Gammaproteobacteria bacterium]|nr:amidase [Gammaproteobacteria bacterium]
MATPLPKNLNELTATEAAHEIAQGRIKAEALVRACLRRIGEREPDVAAWAYMNRAQAIEAARQADESPSRRFKGIPVGFKDIIDTADMPTTYGSPIYRDHRPFADAVCVASTRRAGGIALGKTVTTEFASRFPGPTRNPHSPAHTPGGSSSGSAAAVADKMVPLAIGTQTAGSVIRPASFCGVYGYKASFGLLSFAGVKHFSESVDTLGLMARSLEDIALYRNVLLGMNHHDIHELGTPPRLGYCRTHLWQQADESTQNLLDEAASRLSGAGAQVEDFELPVEFDQSEDLHRRITMLEGRNNLTFERSYSYDNLSASAQSQIAGGDDIEYTQYIVDQRTAAQLRVTLAARMEGFDALITASAPGEAPSGLSYTGATHFNYLWTLMHTPAVTIPAFSGPSGLPVGLQVIAPQWQDDRALAVAAWISSKLL